MAKKKKQTKGGKSLRKAMKGGGAFFRKGKEKPKSPPGEVKPADPKKPPKE
jgi:hypothetical protein